MLKIISGEYKGHKIIFPSNEKTRPTSNMVKESLFNILQFDILKSNFLDLFFGSGQIGIEALSRGAKYVTFVDNSKYCQKCLIKNLDKMNIKDNFKIINMDVILYLSKCKETFDIVFLDAPYDLDISEKVLKKVVNNINKNGIIIVETSKLELLDESFDDFKICNQHIYGKKKLTVYK